MITEVSTGTVPAESIPISTSSKSPTRCTHAYADGRRCRSPRAPESRLCADHSRLVLKISRSPALGQLLAGRSRPRESSDLRAAKRNKAAPSATHSSFHSLHANLESPELDVSADLLGPVEDFRTAAAVNHALGKLLILLAGNRVSPRRGAVLAYTCQLLLQSVAAVDKEIWLTGNADDITKAVRSVLRATPPLQND